MSDTNVREAELEVERARSRLLATVNEVTKQLEPHRLAGEIWETAKIKGADLAEDAVDAVKARPFAATGVVAAIAMFLAREPLIELAGKLIDGASEKRASKKRRKPALSKAEGARNTDKPTEATQ